MDLYLARHGRTSYNDQGIYNADPTVDVHLVPEGLEQAEGVAEKLREVPFGVVYITELPRTGQTAEIINRYHGLPLTVERRLNESCTGFEGRPVIDWYKAMDVTGDRWGFKAGDGESLAETYERICNALADMALSKHPVGLVVGHKMPLRMIMRATDSTQKDLWSYLPPEQGDYTVVRL